MIPSRVGIVRGGTESVLRTVFARVSSGGAVRIESVTAQLERPNVFRNQELSEFLGIIALEAIPYHGDGDKGLATLDFGFPAHPHHSSRS
jgi:hypothetical protein